MFENNPHVDKITYKEELPKDNQAWIDWHAERSRELDKFGNLSHSCEQLLAFFEGSCMFHWPASVRRAWANKSYLEAVHDIFEMPYDFGPLFFPTAKEKAKAKKTKKKVGEFAVGWCLAGTRLDKLYPNTPVAIGRILKEIGPVILFGAPNEKDQIAAKQIQDSVQTTNGSLVGLHAAISPKPDPDPSKQLWSIRRGLTQAQFCDVFVGPDTGLSWGVAFEPLPKVMLMSHASPVNITQHWLNTVALIPDETVKCWPCHQLHNLPVTCLREQRRCGMEVPKEVMEHPEQAGGAACIKSITVETILQAIKLAIDRPKVQPETNVIGLVRPPAAVG